MGTGATRPVATVVRVGAAALPEQKRKNAKKRMFESFFEFKYGKRVK